MSEYRPPVRAQAVDRATFDAAYATAAESGLPLYAGWWRGLHQLVCTPSQPHQEATSHD